jgi:hypothetical protein
MAGKAITRQGDAHIGHASPTPNPFHQSTYKTYADGKLIIVKDNTTGCGDPASGTASKCYAEGIKIHRKGDATGGHGSWVPNASAEGSSKCFAF